MIDEPARGGFPEPGFAALPGIDRARAYLRRLVPRPPLGHLLGIRVTQVGAGTATCTMPCSPWLQTSTAVIDPTAIVEAAVSMAVLTTMPPGTSVRTAAMALTPFRPVTIESETLIARARVVSSGPTFTHCEVLVEDALGREVLRASGTSVVEPEDIPAAPATIADRAVPEPRYASPDPHRRPLPPGVGVVPVEYERYDGTTLARKIFGGELPRPPIMELLGLRDIEVEERSSHLAMPTTDWLCWRRRDRIAPAAVAMLTSRALVTCVYSEVRPGERLAVLAVNFSFLADAVNDGTALVAEGRVTDREGDFVFTKATVTDGRGRRVVVGHHVLTLLHPRPRTVQAAATVVTTVLFTDLVASTETAAELGDERWGEVLARHHTLIRQQLDQFNGREVKTTGDGFLAVFDDPARAVECAVHLRSAVRGLGLELKIGLHTGRCELSDGDVAGIAVHVAARVLQAAAPGEVLVSGTIRDVLLGSEFKFEDRGRHRLKGIDGEWALFAVSD
ncbi:MAG TPA: adenylate/guanylate cyclase domain-containing protein [Acidimicrobiia bacterium]|nr:adenylate/guanylate cyclase domain-containing protein [Acidimicrobiia bacterium]